MLEQLFRGKRMAEVVEALADKFADEQGLAGRDRSEIFEIFAAYCVTSQYRVEFDAEDLHAGQSRDLSIDAYAIIINDVVYTEAADVERVVAKIRQLRVHFVLIQAKRSRKFEGRVFNTMVGDVRHIFSNLLYGIKLYLIGPVALSGREEEIKLACGQIVDVLWDQTGVKQLITALRPAITAALPR